MSAPAITAPRRIVKFEVPMRAVVMSKGSTAVASDRQTKSYDFVLPGSVSDIRALLDTCAQMFDREGVVILDAPPITPELIEREREQIITDLGSAAGAGKWFLGTGALAMEQDGRGSGWMTFTDSEKIRPAVHVGILPWMVQEDTPLFRVDGSWHAKDIATAVARYHQLLGVSFRYNPGSSGSALLRSLYHHRPDPRRRGKYLPEPRWRQDRWQTDNAIMGRGDIVWTRQLTAAEKKMRFVHRWDMRTAYLASASVSEVGWDQLFQSGPGVDGKAAGYYKLLLTTSHKSALFGNKSMPPVINKARVSSGSTVWVTQPILSYIWSLGLNPEILDSFTSERSGRYLREWAETIRDAIKWSEEYRRPQLRETLKATYARAIGLWQNPGGKIYRRDIGHTVEDGAAVSVLRRVGNVCRKTETHETPIEVNVDEIYYASNTANAAELPHGELLGCGPNIGNMVYKGCTSMSVYLTERRKTKGRTK